MSYSATMFIKAKYVECIIEAIHSLMYNAMGLAFSLLYLLFLSSLLHTKNKVWENKTKEDILIKKRIERRVGSVTGSTEGPPEGSDTGHVWKAGPAMAIQVLHLMFPIHCLITFIGLFIGSSK